MLRGGKLPTLSSIQHMLSSDHEKLLMLVAMLMFMDFTK